MVANPNPPMRVHKGFWIRMARFESSVPSQSSLSTPTVLRRPSLSHQRVDAVTRRFYKPQPLCPLEETRANILALERETDGLLAALWGTA